MAYDLYVGTSTPATRTFADCKTKADFLLALGIVEGPEMDETEKVLAKRELGKRDQNERNAIFFSLLSTVVGLGVTTNATTENEMFLLFLPVYCKVLCLIG